ncbi:MAG TPA: biotin/lipoyl-binding protein, partial [Gemmataceae bacterium]|nr:biotin/lipoyl-binding protein [Gemmataceae bacterium]
MKRDSFTAKKTLLLLLSTAVLLVGLGAAGWMIQSRGANEQSRRGDVDPSSAPNHLAAVVAIGAVDVEDGVVALLPLRAGRVAEVLVHENQIVAKDAVLLRLDDRLARFEVQEAEAAVHASEAQLSEAGQAPRQHQLLLQQQRAALAGAHHGLVAARMLLAHRKKLVESRLSSKEEADADAEGVERLAAAESAEQAKLASLELKDPQLDIARARADLQAKQSLLDKARYVLKEQELTAPAN